MPETRPSQIVSSTESSLTEWLAQPDEQIQSLREAIRSAEPIGVTAAKATLRSLQGAEKGIRDQHLRAFADELERALRPLGLKTQSRILQRAPRKKPASIRVAMTDGTIS